MKKIFLLILMTLCLWSSNFEAASVEAKKSNKLLLVELEMEFCPYCEKIEKFVLSKSDVQSVINDSYIFIKLDINKESIPELLTSRMTPTFYILTDDGETIISEIKGAPSKSEFLNFLNKYIKR